MEANKFGDAAVSFTRGLDLAREKGCHMWEGQCARGMLMLYGHLLNGSAQLKYANEAYDAFGKGGHEDWMDWSKLDIAIAYNNKGEYEISYNLAKELAEKSILTRDTLLMEEASVLMGSCAFNLGNYKESVINYKAAYELNQDILKSVDLRKLFLSTTMIDIRNDLEILQFLNNVSSKDAFQPSFSFLAKNGKYEEAYADLFKYSQSQDSIFCIILENNVSESIDKYEITRAAIRQVELRNERFIWIILLLSCIVIGLLATQIFLNAYRKKKKKVREMAENIERIKSDLSHQIENNKLMAESLVSVVRDRYEDINRECDKFFETRMLSSDKSKAYANVKKTVKDFTSISYLNSVANYIDKYTENLFSSFKKDFFELPQESINFYLYLILGFSARTIAVILDKELDVVYNRKSRLKTKIKQSNSIRKNDYLNMIK